MVAQVNGGSWPRHSFYHPYDLGNFTSIANSIQAMTAFIEVRKVEPKVHWQSGNIVVD
jgi:hypothetical protein